MSKLGNWLESIGFKHPSHKEPGVKYTNVDGKYSEVDKRKPIMLVTYIPRKKEMFFESLSEARKSIPKNNEIVWQILNAITGEILQEPKKIVGYSSVDSRHRHKWLMNCEGNGKMSNVMGHIHTIKNFEVSVDNQHKHKLYNKSFK